MGHQLWDPKHRLEKDNYAFEFEDVLEAGDSLQDIDSIEVTKRVGSSYRDVSAEFGTPTGTATGTQAQFVLDVAQQADHQDADADYVVFCRVNTSNGSKLVGEAPLEVVDEGDTS